MARLTSSRVLRALSRFDTASYRDVADVIGRETANARRDVRKQLEGLVAEGFASRDGTVGHVQYAITDAGRAQLARYL